MDEQTELDAKRFRALRDDPQGVLGLDLLADKMIARVEGMKEKDSGEVAINLIKNFADNLRTHVDHGRTKEDFKLRVIKDMCEEFLKHHTPGGKS